MEKGQISMATEEEKGRNLTGRKVGGCVLGKNFWMAMTLNVPGGQNKGL